MLIDYYNIFQNKNHSVVSKHIINRMAKIAKEKDLKVILVDSELTIKNKKYTWKFV